MEELNGLNYDSNHHKWFSSIHYIDINSSSNFPQLVFCPATLVRFALHSTAATLRAERAEAKSPKLLPLPVFRQL